MYPVAQEFHDLIKLPGAKTRCRIYLFDKTVDPTDDNAVEANGTMLRYGSDYDSNGRIESTGIVWNDIFNNGVNPQIGQTVSVTFGFSLINTDGAYSTYQFDRCKIYVDVYSEETGEWYACPMGAYIIETPEQTYGSIIHLSGYDMMQDLNGIADSWFNALDYTTPLTIGDILSSLATACGKTLNPNTLTNLINSNVSFSAAPFNSVERTYRDILSWIAEVTASVARFDRNGYLDLHWFDDAQINGTTYYINVDSIGCGVFNLVRSSYAVATIDGISARSVNLDNTVSVGSTNSVYQIMGNPFIADDDATAVTNKITPILAELNSLGAYTPLSVKAIFDPSIESGDIINVVYGGATYRMPIFQQKILWKGSIIVSELLSTGQAKLPSSESEADRDDYRIEKNFNERVTFTDLATGGSTVINGDNITTGSISADRIYGGTLNMGGNNNQYGTINVYDNNGNLCGQIASWSIRLFRDSGNRPDEDSTRINGSSMYVLAGSDNRIILGLGEPSGYAALRMYPVSVGGGITAESGRSGVDAHVRVWDGNAELETMIESSSVKTFYNKLNTSVAARMYNDSSNAYLNLYKTNGNSGASLSASGVLTLGATSLNEAQLQQLLALI